MGTKIFVFIFALGAFLIADSDAFGAPSPKVQTYTFDYQFEGLRFQYSVKHSDWKVAFTQGADACFDFFRTQRRPSGERGIDLIDVCANPKERRGT